MVSLEMLVGRNCSIYLDPPLVVMFILLSKMAVSF